MIENHIKAVFFDLYGTLLVFKDYEDSDKNWIDVFYKMIGKPNGLNLQETQSACYEILECNIEKDLNNGLTTYETKIKKIFGSKGIHFSKEQLREIADRSLVKWQINILPDSDALLVLHELRKHYKLALITNFDHSPHIRKVLDQFKFENEFDLVVISDEEHCTKPDPRIFNLALKHFELEPENAIYIGDNIHDDIMGSFNAGITPIMIDRNSRSNHRDNKYFNNAENNLPKYQTIYTLSELLNLLS